MFKLHIVNLVINEHDDDDDDDDLLLWIPYCNFFDNFIGRFR